MYNLGNNRLFYTSLTAEGTTVLAEILNPKLEKHSFEMIQFEGNVYYLDIIFCYHGPYLFSVFEDGIEKHKDILHVSLGKHVIYPESGNFV